MSSYDAVLHRAMVRDLDELARGGVGVGDWTRLDKS
jgi:hypothetical protein